jgi:hypothetical protein
MLPGDFDLCKSYRNFTDNNITVFYPDKSQKLFAIPALVKDIVEEYKFEVGEYPIVGAYVNNQLLGLSDVVDINVVVLKPVYLNSSEGSKVTFLLLKFIYDFNFKDL